MNVSMLYLFFLLFALASNLAEAQECKSWDICQANRMVNEPGINQYSFIEEPAFPIKTTPNQLHSSNKAMPVTAIIPDFQVNENRGPNGASQYFSSVATDKNGNFVIVWEDYRNGDSDIYAQRYSSNGTIAGNNFKVNDDQVNAEQRYSCIAVDGIGNFIIAWTDHRMGDWDIYVQRFASNGSALEGNIKVTDDQANAYYCNPPSIASDDDGNFIIVWRGVRNGVYGIYAQRISNNGTVLGSNFQVNENETNIWHYDPSVSTDSHGNFVVVWKKESNSDYGDIFLQRYSNDGTALGNNFKVNDDEGTTSQFAPSIATNKSGNFLITWEDCRNGSNEIYAQLFSNDGEPIKSNYKVSDNHQNVYERFPSISANGSGEFIIAWMDSRESVRSVYAQRYSSGGTALGHNFKVAENRAKGYQYALSISADSSGNFIATWDDERYGDDDIYAQRYSIDEAILAQEFKVNDDKYSAPQTNSSIATSAVGNFVITWQDYSNGGPDIYAQQFSTDGTAVKSNFRVADTLDSAWKYGPSIASDSTGNYVITWIDKRNDKGDIYAQRYSSDGTGLGRNFKVNDDQEEAIQLSSSLAMDGNGNFIIIWADERSGKYDIYAQRFSSDGTRLGYNFKVNENEGSGLSFGNSVASDISGNFIIVWCDYTDGDYNIYAQRYSNEGTVLGPNFKVNTQSTTHRLSPCISINSSENFVIAWTDYQNGDYDIYAQRYSSNGSAVGSNFKVNDDHTSAAQNSPSIAADRSGNFVITWEDHRNGDNGDIYAQRFSSDGTAFGSNFRVTSSANKIQHSPDIKLCNNKIYTTWTDNQVGGTSFDIWANVLDWDSPVEVISPEIQPQLAAFKLNQNFPNPFNVSTKISYELPRSTFVILNVYDILGHEIKRLAHEFQTAGLHSVIFEGDEFSNGIYFYKLQIGFEFVQTKSMLLIK